MARRKKEDMDEKPDPFSTGANDAAEFLNECVDTIEAKELEILEMKEEIREVFKELGGRGYDTKMVRKAMKTKKERRQNETKWEMDQQIFRTYLGALGIETDEAY